MFFWQNIYENTEAVLTSLMSEYVFVCVLNTKLNSTAAASS